MNDPAKSSPNVNPSHKVAPSDSTLTKDCLPQTNHPLSKMGPLFDARPPREVYLTTHDLPNSVGAQHQLSGLCREPLVSER